MPVNKKVVEFTNMGATVPAATDDLVIIDVSDTTDDATGTSKRWEWLDFLRELFATRFGADAGASDTYVVTLTPAPAAYVTGEHYRFKANTANTGACTINFNALGAKAIKKAAGGITTDLADNDIRVGQWVDLVYDGTNMQMQSLLGNAPAGGAGGIGDVVGPASATDLALARFDGTTGKLIQNSTVTLDDVGAITMPEMAAPATPAAGNVSLYAKADGLLYSKDDAGLETVVTGGGGGGSIAPLTIIDANTVHQKNGANVQTFAVFKTTTNNVRFEITNASSTWELASKSDAGVDAINLSIGTSKYQFGTGALLPPSNQGQNLGSSSVIWSLIYGASFDCKADGLYRWTNATKLSSAADGVLEIRRDSNAGGTVKCSPLSPAQITADQNNYNMGGCSLNVRLSTDASRSLTGLVSTPSQVTGQIHYITNVGSNNLVLVHESASSTATNRFLNNTGTDITLVANEVAYVWYDGTTQRWRASKL